MVPDIGRNRSCAVLMLYQLATADPGQSTDNNIFPEMFSIADERVFECSYCDRKLDKINELNELNFPLTFKIS